MVELARALLDVFKVLFQFLVDVFLTALDLINKLPFTSSYISSFELLFHFKPNYHSLNIFSFQCFPWLKPYSPSKLHPKSLSRVFLGSSLNHYGYRCHDHVTNHLYVSRHVNYHESIFPFLATVSSSYSDHLSYLFLSFLLLSRSHFFSSTVSFIFLIIFSPFSKFSLFSTFLIIVICFFFFIFFFLCCCCFNLQHPSYAYYV